MIDSVTTQTRVWKANSWPVVGGIRHILVLELLSLARAVKSLTRAVKSTGCELIRDVSQVFIEMGWIS